MLRRAISCAVAGLLIAIAIWMTAYAVDTDWIPHPIVPLIVAFVGIAGVMWLYDEIRDAFGGKGSPRA